MSNSKCVYYKEKEQKSFDGGITWQDTGNFRKGALVSTQASQCGSYTNEYRWIKADYVCDNANKYNGYKQQVSYDNGGSWVDTGVVDIGDLIETNSKDCGYDERWFTLTGDNDFICHGSSKYKKKEMKYTRNSGTTWNSFDSPKYEKGDLIEENSKDCATGDTGTTTGSTTGGTLSMKVTYTDGTEKKFYNLDEIYNNTDSNKIDAKEVVIYDSVTRIGYRAFANCSSLTSITIQNGVKIIDDYAFFGCTSLSSIIIPDSVTSIGYYAFQNCSSLSSITIPNSVTSIRESAFQSCSSLTSITLPLGLELISGRLFYNCENLESVTIPDSVKSIGDNAFYGCSSLSSITIPNSVTSIGDYAFRGTNLTSLTLPDSLTSIGIAVFANCTSLSSITIPDSVTSIGNYAFYDCSSLTSMTVNATTPPSLGESAIPSNIQRIYVPADSLDTYKSAVVWKDYADKIWVIGYDEKWFVLTGDKDFICDEGSKYKKKEMKYTRDSGTTWNSFDPPKYEKGDLIAQTSTDCASMKVTYTDNTEKTFTGLASIEKDTVPNKPNVKNVEIHNGVKSIGNSAFSGCTSLTSITIPNSVETIDDFSFNSCSHITEITIPSSVEWIGNAAFDYCSNLKSVTIQNSTTRLQLNSSTFSNISSDRSLFVPLSVWHLYKDDGNWSIAFNGNIYPIS